MRRRKYSLSCRLSAALLTCLMPLSALADQTQRMLVVAGTAIVIRDGDTTVEVPTFCLDYRRKAPGENVSLAQFVGTAVVERQYAGHRWVTIGSLPQVIQSHLLEFAGVDHVNLLTGETIGRYSVIQLRHGVNWVPGTYRVRFQESTVCGPVDLDLSGAAGDVQKMEALAEYARTHSLSRRVAQSAYWVLSETGSLSRVDELTALPADEFLAQLRPLAKLVPPLTGRGQ